jgi:glycosyltransferase involved in cell wall biosynthesis
VIIYDCHATLWRGVEDRVAQASGGWRSLGFLHRILQAYWQLWRKHRQIPEYDVMLIGYPGPFDAYLGRLLAWRRRVPMVIDHYMSLFLIAQERGLVEKSPFTGKLIRTLEAGGLKLADLLISDTLEYIDFHCQTYHLSPDKFALVPAGADDSVFTPLPDVQLSAESFRILYYGTYIHNHGVPTMIEAAALLRDRSDIRFDFYGDGPEREAAIARARQLDLTNVHFHGWIDKDKLPREIAASHVCLGVFGMTKQSLITIQNKIWESMMMQRPVITGDAPTIRNRLQHNEQIYLIERDNPDALATGIMTLKHDSILRERIARGGYETAQQNTVATLGQLTKQALELAYQKTGK